MHERDLDDANVQAAVREVADEYLDDPNINSVGVGYKETDGERTDELVLQFTVGQKFAPEALATAPTREIPETIERNGITFGTDVIERDFAPHQVVTFLAVERRRRVDPMVPGVSIANVDVTAGTLGCFVRENGTGKLRALSNWHVLDGGGDVGDPIAQPGPLDDPRASDNLCGRLVRSFLGFEGDCAIASVFNRGADDTILGLDTAVRAVGDPALGDTVVKSGRTTGVTYGVVTRVHTITNLNYGPAGVKRISGFEIGPDPQRPADNGEISMGGDSGSAWMAVGDGGAARDTMVGLHFAGETVEPAEYALACYAAAVFAKLDISPVAGESGGATSSGEQASRGYDRGFLPGAIVELPAPGLRAVQDDYAPTTSGAVVRAYTHFSLAMSATRRFCRWVAWNVDGSGLVQLSRTGLEFVLDGEYDPEFQVDDGLYSGNRLDRGHIARRADLLWGTRAEAQRANADSFFFTNITPQLDDFNQSSRHGLWGELEDAIFEDVDVDDLRLSVLGGPIFKDTDLQYRDVLVPRSFWKVIAYVEGGTLKAKAFVLTQDDLEAKLESLGLDRFNLYQVSLAGLAEMTGLTYGALAAADTMPPSPEAEQGPAVRRIEARAEIAA
jgi:endonuclease G, mitochondrial